MLKHFRPLKAAIFLIGGVLVEHVALAQAASPPPLAARLISAPLVAPNAAWAAYGSSTTHTNGVAAWSSLPPEMAALARSLGNFPEMPTDTYIANVFEYVRNNIDTEFRFGLGKGGRGALVDQSGTPFDQAELMVKLLRAKGIAASYETGTITLTAQQFGTWTGLVSSYDSNTQAVTVDAAAACQLLADGGIPGACTPSSGTLASIQMGHIWVAVGNLRYDPSFKPSTLYDAGVDVSAAMSCGTANASTCGTVMTSQATNGNGYVSGTTSVSFGANGTATLPFVQNLNEMQLNAWLLQSARSLQTRIQNTNPLASVAQVVGGRELKVTPTPTGVTSLSYVTESRPGWTDIPDPFRTTLRVRIGGIATDRLFYADELAGRRLQLTQEPAGMLLDGTPLSANGCPSCSGSNVLLTVDHPYPTSGYADETRSILLASVGGDPNYFPAFGQFPATIVHGFGNAGVSTERHYAALQEVLPSDYSISYDLWGSPEWGDVHWGVQMSFTNREQVMLAARVLSQSAAADRIISGLSKSVIQRHHTLGVIYTEGISPGTLNNMSIEPVSSVISATGDASARRAAFETSAATFATLEGSVNQQLNSTDTGVSMASSFWSANTDLSGKRREKFVEMTNAELRAVFGNQDGAVAGGFGAIFSLNNTEASFYSALYVGADAVGHMVGGTKGGSSITSDPYSKSMETVKVAEQAAARKKYLNVSPADGSATITETDLVTGAGEFPQALPFTRTYLSGTSVQETGSPLHLYKFALDGSEQVVNSDTYTLGYSGPDAAANSHIGGGWTHNYNVTASYTGDAGKALGQDYAIESAASIAALRAIYDAARSPTLASRVTSALASFWLARYQWVYNSVVVDKGGSSESFQRLPDDSFFTPKGSTRLVQSGKQTLTNDFSPVSFTYTGKDGDTIAFSVARYSKTPVCCNAETKGDPVFKADLWTFPDGTIVSFNYGLAHLISSGNAQTYPDVTCGPGSNCPAGTIQLPMGYVLGSVTNNRGRSLTFTTVNTQIQTFVQTSSGDDPQMLSSRFTITRVTGESGNWVQYSMAGCPSTSPWLCERLEVTTVDGVSIYSYVPGADSPNPAAMGRGPYRLRRWFTPSDAVKPFRVVTYDEMFRVAIVTDPLNNSTRYYPSALYGPERWKRSETVSPVGAVSVDYFDNRNNLLKSVNPLGHVTVMEYDQANRKTKTTRPEGDRVEQAYDVRSNVLATVRYAKPGSNYPTYTSSTTYVEGPAVTNCTDWKTCNKPQTQTDARTHTTTYAYNSTTGQQVSETGPSVPLAGGSGNTFTRLCYTSLGGVSMLTGTIKRVNGSTNRVRTYSYNSSNKYVLQTATDDPTTTLTIPGDNSLACPTASKTDAKNIVTTLSFDIFGNLQIVNGPRNDVSDETRYTFDRLRRLTSITAPLGAVTRHCYDHDGLLTATYRARVPGMTIPDSGSATYNGFCGPENYPVASWQSEQRTYFATGDLRTVQDDEENVTRYAYDPAGQLIVVEDPDYRQTATVYDLAGQVIATWRGGKSWIDGYGKPNLATVPGETTPWDPNSYVNDGPNKDHNFRYASYAYTPNGKRLSVLDANNNKTLYDYDGHDRLAFTRFPDPASGAPCSLSLPVTTTPTISCSGNQTYEKYTYDQNDNRETLRSRNGHTITWTYDDANRMQTKAVSGGTPALPTVTYGYNLVSEPTSLTSPALGGIPAHSTTYDYDGAGRKLYEENQLDQARRVSYLYDDKVNRTRTSWHDGYFVNYEFDALNRMKYARENGTNELAYYDYDPLSRRKLLRFANQTSNRIDYTYELDGNLDLLTNVLNTVNVTLDHGHNASGQLNRVVASDYTYLPTPTTPGITAYVADKLNRYASFGGNAATYDNNGNLLSWNSDNVQRTYSYDAENRLRTASAGGTTVATYDYDALGRRISKDAGGTKTYYVLDGDEEIGEISGGVLQRRYIMGPAIDDRVARAERNSDGSFTNTYYHVNHQGSVIATTNASGTLVQKISYDEFGKSAADATGEPFRYTGRRFDAESGLYYYRARYYSPTLGRFLQTDPVGHDDDVNLYAYVRNDPLNRVDPRGRNALAIGVGIGILLTAGACEASGGCDEARDAAGQLVDTVIEGIKWAAVPPGVVLAEPEPRKTATANPDGTVTDAQGKPIKGSSGGPGAGKRFPAESPAAKEAKEGVPCRYCGQPTTNEPGKENSRQRDHVDPKSQGGNNTKGNEADSCRKCNRDKWAKPLWDWVKEKFGMGAN